MGNGGQSKKEGEESEGGEKKIEDKAGEKAVPQSLIGGGGGEKNRGA